MRRVSVINVDIIDSDVVRSTLVVAVMSIVPLGLTGHFPQSSTGDPSSLTGLNLD